MQLNTLTPKSIYLFVMLAMNKSNAVIDEGPGISLEEQQKIFEPFYTG